MAKELVTKADATGEWEFQLQDRNGNVDLSTASGVTLFLRLAGAAALTIDGGTCTITDAANGKVEYAPTTNDVDTAGTYDLEIKVTWNDGKTDKFPSDGYTVTRLTADLEG